MAGVIELYGGEQHVTGFLTEMRDIKARRRICGLKPGNLTRIEAFEPFAQLQHRQRA